MKRNKKGFTIVELVIVIGVIGILSAILIPTFVSLTDKAKNAAMKEECASAYSAYSLEAMDGHYDEYSKYYKIEYGTVVSQDKVQLENKDGDRFHYSLENGWEALPDSIASFTKKAIEVGQCSVVSNPADDDDLSDDEKTAITTWYSNVAINCSTFNGYVVYVA